MRMLLASASPARLATLRAAGIDPQVQASGVDEESVLAAERQRRGALTVTDSVQLLAQAKAEDVAATAPDADLVVGCDSLLDLDGEAMGKPGSAQQASDRWHRMRGRTGVLRTGHYVRTRDGRTAAGASATTVTFADISDAEIAAYIATGEPLAVAGAFTLDGLGGAYVSGVDGDPHGVVGISLPLLRQLLHSLDITWHDLWAAPPWSPSSGA